MIQNRLRIFLSSTFSDLFIERRAVEAVIHRMALTYVGMEHFGSFASEPLAECLKKVCVSDFFILALGSRYGSRPEGNVGSFTEAEYNEAERQNKPILAYFASYLTDDSVGAEPVELSRLKNNVSKKHGVSTFESPEDLAWKVACDLHRELPQFSIADVPDLANRTQELVDFFRRRADVIERDLSPHYKYAVVKNYLDEFRVLHQEHLSYLSKGNLILAHEVVVRIHELSFRLERDEFWKKHYAETPDVLYCLAGDAFRHGWISKFYCNEFPWAYGSDVLMAFEQTRAKSSRKEISAADLYISLLHSCDTGSRDV